MLWFIFPSAKLSEGLNILWPRKHGCTLWLQGPVCHTVGAEVEEVCAHTLPRRQKTPFPMLSSGPCQVTGGSSFPCCPPHRTGTDAFPSTSLPSTLQWAKALPAGACVSHRAAAPRAPWNQTQNWSPHIAPPFAQLAAVVSNLFGTDRWLYYFSFIQKSISHS